MSYSADVVVLPFLDEIFNPLKNTNTIASNAPSPSKTLPAIFIPFLALSEIELPPVTGARFSSDGLYSAAPVFFAVFDGFTAIDAKNGVVGIFKITMFTFFHNLTPLTLLYSEIDDLSLK